MLDVHPLCLEYQFEILNLLSVEYDSVVKCKVMEDSVLNCNQNITEFS